jgi:hypothetical protein
MRKAKKSPKVQYGIEITKPWSKEMYDHNDIVSDEMKKNIIKKWDSIIKRLDMDQDWCLLSDDSEIVKLQKGICYSGYGSGYTLEEVDREFRDEVENMPNYQLHETYSYLAFERMLPRTRFMLIGFEWEKFDYHVIGSQEMTSPAVLVHRVVDKLMKDSLDA